MPRKRDPNAPRRPVGRPKKAPLEVPALPPAPIGAASSDEVRCCACAGVISLSDLLTIERQASEQGLVVLNGCIAAAKRALEAGKYDTQLAEHLAALIDKRAQVYSKIRAFGEKVKVQSSTLTPEQERRAVAKFIAELPSATLREFRALIDKRIDDIGLVRI